MQGRTLMTLPLSEASTDEVASAIRRFKSPENRFKVCVAVWHAEQVVQPLQNFALKLLCTTSPLLVPVTQHLG